MESKTRLMAFNIDMEIYKALRQFAFDKNITMSSLINTAVLRELSFQSEKYTSGIAYKLNK